MQIRIRNRMIAVFTIIILISGCGKPNEEILNHMELNKKSTELDINKGEEAFPSDQPVAPLEPIVIEEEGKLLKLGEKVKDPFLLEGDLYYVVENCNIYEDITQLQLEKENFSYPDSFFYSNDIGNQYLELSDYMTEEGKLKAGIQFLMLELYIKNEDANGLEKKNEFNLNSISLLGGEPVNRYGIVYFNESGKINDTNQILYFELEQGQEKRVQIGYFVLSEDLKKGKLVGKINETQFEIY